MTAESQRLRLWPRVGRYRRISHVFCYSSPHGASSSSPLHLLIFKKQWPHGAYSRPKSCMYAGRALFVANFCADQGCRCFAFLPRSCSISQLPLVSSEPSSSPCRSPHHLPPSFWSHPPSLDLSIHGSSLSRIHGWTESLPPFCAALHHRLGRSSSLGTSNHPLILFDHPAMNLLPPTPGLDELQTYR